MSGYARDFNNMETRAVIKFSFPPARQGKALKKIHAILTETLAYFFLVGLKTYQLPCKDDVLISQQSCFVIYLPMLNRQNLGRQ